MKKILMIIIIFFQSELNAEEYVGSIILSDSTIYTFQLNLIINKENITGYSITNYGTGSETKSSIEGTFDKTKNKPKKRRVKLSKGRNSLVISAVNEGTNPPNTSAVEIKVENKVYQIQTDLEVKNDIIIFIDRK